MNETLYSWTFNFHKVVRQQNSGAVEDFILPYTAVYLRIQKWKNYWNRSTFAKVIVKIKVARFYGPRCRQVKHVRRCCNIRIIHRNTYRRMHKQPRTERTDSEAEELTSCRKTTFFCTHVTGKRSLTLQDCSKRFTLCVMSVFCSVIVVKDLRLND